MDLKNSEKGGLSKKQTNNAHAKYYRYKKCWVYSYYSCANKKENIISEKAICNKKAANNKEYIYCYNPTRKPNVVNNWLCIIQPG